MAAMVSLLRPQKPTLAQRFPPPCRWMEREVLRHAALGLGGNQAAAEILRHKGFRGSLHVIPQFGIDPELFAPQSGAGPFADESG